MGLRLVVNNDPLSSEDRARENEIARLDRYMQTISDRKAWGVAWYKMQKLISERSPEAIEYLEKEKGLR